ncbi:MAG: SMP-30/gluconolactonase/LRE family protein [Alphaproteobacteria bacterium]|nr:SMP-30/gluconolactonase/LRE family protein [Alphaproteobacteria bacterium]
MTKVDCLHPGEHILGESPVWSAPDEALYWVDIQAPAIHRLRPSSGEVRTWVLPEQVGSIGLRSRGGGLVAATKSGFHFFDPATGGLRQIVDPERHLPENRFNDGRCDRAGRFWAGTMNESSHDAVGALYCLEPNLTVRRMETGVGIPNSLAWSPDDRVMYFADSTRRRIWAYDFDVADGVIWNRRVFVDARNHPGVPDGSTVDAEGCLWNAEHGGSRVCRYTPAGHLDRAIELPVTQPTCCVFGGKRLEILYITTAREGLAPEQLARQPLAGGVFALTPGVAGLPEPGFAG